MQEKKQDLSSSSTEFDKKMAVQSSQFPHETPDYAGGRGFKVPQPAEALAAARMITVFTPPPQGGVPPTERAEVNVTLGPLRTYKDDIASVLSSEQSSVASIALAEQKKQALHPDTNKQARRVLAGKRATSLGLNVLLICLGGLILGAVYMLIQLRVRPAENQGVPSVVARDEKIVVDISTLTPSTVVPTLRNHIERSSLTTDKIAQIELTKISPATAETQSETKVVSAHEFLSLIGAKPSPTLTRSLEETFMLGIHQTDKANPFILFKTTFFESAFSEMFRWERTIAAEFAPLFGISISETTASQPVFSDLIIENRDARALRDDEGKILLLYSFLDQKTLLIATNPETVREVFSRLTSIRVVE